MSRPSEPLLAWLRDMLKTKGLNTAHVAEAAKLDRSRVRKILAGTEPMTVDELMALSEALDLDPQDLTGQKFAENLPSPSEKILSAAPDLDEHSGPEVDPFGNQPEQLFRVAFGLGCTFLFITNPEELADSGVPATVLRQYKDQFPIRLEAAYHKYNEPKYSEEGISLTLSFDALYECYFPWSSIVQFVLFPDAPDPKPSEPPAQPGSHLRLVT